MNPQEPLILRIFITEKEQSIRVQILLKEKEHTIVSELNENAETRRVFLSALFILQGIKRKSKALALVMM